MKLFTIIISAITTFIIIGCGSLGAVLVALEGKPLSTTAVAVCIITGMVAAMKDIRSTMSLPPLSNGNYAAIAQFMRNDTAQFRKYQALEASKQTTEKHP